MLCELEGEGRANIHNIMVLAGGEVISECSRPGYSVNHWQLSHSMTKSITGMAVGLLYDDDLVTLDTRLVDVFPEIPYKDKRFAAITIEHLLTMTSGVPFNEAGTVTESRWSEAFFSSPLRFAPGARFHYNSMNSYILSRVVSELSGRRFTEYVDERIFRPLGITNYFFEAGPEGYEKGGWGLYMSAESWAKLGLMFMGGGAYRGRRILSEEWVRLSGETYAISPSFNGDFNYGYQMWVARESRQLLFNGMLGQNVWMCPDNDIVVVMQSGNNELFQDSPALAIIRRHLGGEIEDPISFKDLEALHYKETHFMESCRWVHPLEKHQGLLYFLGIKSRAPFDEGWDRVLGTYKFPKNNSGILPIFVRAMQNSLEGYIDRITFSREGEELYLTVVERDGVHKIEIGLYEYKTTVLDLRGERYIVSAMGEIEVNPDGFCAFRVELLYPELPNTLMLRFRKTLGDRMALSITEIPNSGVAGNMATRLVDSHTYAQIIMNVLDARFGEEVIRERMESAFAPSFVLADMGCAGYEKIIADEDAIAREDSSLVKMIKGVVDKYIRYDEDDEVPREQKAKSIFKSAKEKLKKKK